MEKTNTGNGNTGNWNTGDWNTGGLNTGNWNTGDWNTGNWNTGNSNTGDRNTGNRNTGNRNTGDRNTGGWNTGNGNTGYCNTSEPKIRIFNKETEKSLSEIAFPDYFYFNLTEWIEKRDMSEKERQDNEQYKVTGGYLKVYDYKEAWRRSWNATSLEDRKKTLELPNWDNAIFLEISGIDVEKELSEPELDDATEEAINLLKSKGFKIVKS